MEKIFAGLKKYEFRRVIFKSQAVSRIIIYASSPVKRVVGGFEVGAILTLGKGKLWHRTKRHSWDRKAFFDAYFRGRKICFAIKIKGPRRYESPMLLQHLCDAAHPPQSFMYLED